MSIPSFWQSDSMTAADSTATGARLTRRKRTAFNPSGKVTAESAEGPAMTTATRAASDYQTAERPGICRRLVEQWALNPSGRDDGHGARTEARIHEEARTLYSCNPLRIDADRREF